VFHNLEQVKEANRRLGHHWFSKDTLRFFGGRVLPTLYGNRFFVTSEFTGFDRTARAYTVRLANPDGTVERVGELGAYQTRKQAVGAAKRAAKAPHCGDCGEPYKETGHQDCRFPSNH
jgi:hypothetical protein